MCVREREVVKTYSSFVLVVLVRVLFMSVTLHFASHPQGRECESCAPDLVPRVKAERSYFILLRKKKKQQKTHRVIQLFFYLHQSHLSSPIYPIYLHLSTLCTPEAESLVSLYLLSFPFSLYSPRRSIYFLLMFIPFVKV